MNSIYNGESLKDLELNLSENLIEKLDKIQGKNKIKNINLNLDDNRIKDINLFISNLNYF
jgi:hypothetical protein